MPSKKKLPLKSNMLAYLLICMIACILISLIIVRSRRSPQLHKLGFPFRMIADRTGIRNDVVVLGAPFRNDNHRDTFLELKSRGVKVIGFTHYQNFPATIDNPFEDKYWTKNEFDYISSCDGWCYCHRDPDAIGLPRENRIDLVESDFADIHSLCAHISCDMTEKDIDFVYSLPSELVDDHKNSNRCSLEWQAHCRNWKLARECLPILCDRLGLSGAIIGRDCVDDMQELGIESKITLHKRLKYNEFLTLLKRARFLFVPNISDASPRVITEALALNTPVVVNKDIIGGWKYVNDRTGASFTSPDDVEAAVNHVLTVKTAQDEFLSTWGRQKSSERFSSFLRQLGVNADETVMLKV